MQERWETYLTVREEHPASVLVRLAPGPGARPVLCRVTIALRTPTPEGLSTSDEFGRLKAVDEALEAGLQRSLNAVYMGRVTTRGQRNYYFYTAAETTGIEAGAKEALASFPEYPPAFEWLDDPELEYYDRNLAPTAEDGQRIANAKVLHELIREGDRLTERREVDHWLFFDEFEAACRACEAAAAQGFALRGPGVDYTPDGDRYVLHIYREESLRPSNIDGVTLELRRLAEAHGGDYDGWETELRV